MVHLRIVPKENKRLVFQVWKKGVNTPSVPPEIVMYVMFKERWQILSSVKKFRGS